MSDAPRPRSKLDRFAKLIEDSLLVGLLVALIVVATGQIVLRNVYGTGLSWSDESMRLLVLWLAMAAAIAASRDDRHLSIDVLSRFLAGAGLAVVRVVVALFTSLVCMLLAWHAARFVNDARVFEDVLLGGLPAWLLQIIMPVAFAIMALRYLIHAWSHLRSLSRPPL